MKTINALAFVAITTAASGNLLANDSGDESLSLVCSLGETLDRAEIFNEKGERVPTIYPQPDQQSFCADIEYVESQERPGGHRPPAPPYWTGSVDVAAPNTGATFKASANRMINAKDFSLVISVKYPGNAAEVAASGDAEPQEPKVWWQMRGIGASVGGIDVAVPVEGGHIYYSGAGLSCHVVKAPCK